MNGAPKQYLRYRPFGLLPIGLFSKHIHTKAMWAARMALLWLLVTLAAAFHWPGSITVRSVMAWIGAVAWTAFMTWVAWRWIRLRSQTGKDWLDRCGLSPRRQSVSRIAVVACMPLLAVELWTPTAFEVSHMTLLASRVLLFAGLVFLMWVLPTGLAELNAKAEAIESRPSEPAVP